jgi:SAM-dependent methyltransferase
MAATHIATQFRSLEEVLADLPAQEARFRILLARLSRVRPLPAGARVLDIGAAAGTAVAALVTLGYQCEGVEPAEEARQRGEELFRRLGFQLTLLAGTAENLPHPDNSFDLVLATSVLEHVLDLHKALAEARRVLKPHGVFWFSTTSSSCPFQNEIRGFPLFGWYPLSVKRRIMRWAVSSRPQLVAFTDTPAIHWLTPRGIHGLLRSHGFVEVYDRWDLRLETEAGPLHALALRAIRSSRLAKMVADVLVPDCAYAAIK